MSAVYTIKLNVFEGPLDLLLHLISKAKVDIQDISISDITEQYLAYLDEAKKFDIEIASEFLVMASTLLYIKSRSLVPRNNDDAETDEEYDDIDSQEKLIQKLIEYKQYKKMGQKLQTRNKLCNKIYYKVPEEINLEGIRKEFLYGLTKDDLLKAFEKVMASKKIQKQKKETQHIIQRRTITLQDRTHQLETLLDKRESLSFFGLFEYDCEKIDVIITFLALLEMIREGKVRLYQEGAFQDITIRKRG